MRTVLAGLVLSVMTIIMSPIAVAAHVLRYDERKNSVQLWCMQTWARAVCWAAGVRLVVHGAEHIVPSRGTVFASNHVSWFDIFATAAVLPRFTFVAKEELRRIPIFGWGAEGAGVVFLARDNRQSAFDAYAQVAGKIAGGVSVIVYPEGTRGESYALRPFKKGPFVLAIAAHAPVTPVVVHGAREVMPRGTWRVTSGTVHVHILEPVATTGYDYDHRHDLMETVWRRMSDTLRDVHAVPTPDSMG